MVLQILFLRSRPARYARTNLSCSYSPRIISTTFYYQIEVLWVKSIRFLLI